LGLDLRNTALAGCRESLQNCAVEEQALGLPVLSGWAIEEIELHFDRCLAVFSSALLNYPFLDTQIGLYVKDESGALRPIGRYRLITRLDGDIIDDYLVIDVEKR
jgi:hypothetical protein